MHPDGPRPAGNGRASGRPALLARRPGPHEDSRAACDRALRQEDAAAVYADWMTSPKYGPYIVFGSALYL